MVCALTVGPYKAIDCGVHGKALEMKKIHKATLETKDNEKIILEDAVMSCDYK